MTQPYRGRTAVVLMHPSQDISWRTLDNVGEVSSKLSSAINSVAQGVAYADTTAYVEQGGVQAYGTVTLSGVGGTAASGTFTYSSASGTTTATLNSVAFAQTTGTDAARGIALRTAINASTNVAIQGLFIASDNGSGVVTVTAVNKGTSGNAYTLAVTGTGLARSGATLAGGAQGEVTVTVNGTDAITDTTNMTDAAAAAAVAQEVSGDGDIEPLASATASGAVVTVTANDYSPSGNLITLTAATDTGTATTGHLSGGQLSGGTYPTGQYLRRP